MTINCTHMMMSVKFHISIVVTELSRLGGKKYTAVSHSTVYEVRWIPSGRLLFSPFIVENYVCPAPSRTVPNFSNVDYLLVVGYIHESYLL